MCTIALKLLCAKHLSATRTHLEIAAVAASVVSWLHNKSVSQPAPPRGSSTRQIEVRLPG
jgi:hypothetical protein